jgi:predicted metal-dependent hydrolase
VHELVHLIERGHGPRFKALMDRFLPGWRVLRRELNSFETP